MSLASRRWGRADRRGQILADDPLFVKALRKVSGIRYQATGILLMPTF
jgi:hypothetical protein